MRTYNESDKIKSKLDRLKKPIKNKTSKARKNIISRIKKLKKKYFSALSKITRLIHEMHFKTSLFLCKNFSTILIPEYKIKALAENLSSLVNRSNLALSHYLFRKKHMYTAKRLKKTFI